MAHIAHLKHEVARERRHDILEILDGGLLSWFEPAVNVAKNRYPHRRSQLARRSDTSTGDFFPKIASASTVHSRRSVREGISYMMSSITSSRIERRPRAPVLRRAASLATACSASSAKDRWIFSYSKSF